MEVPWSLLWPSAESSEWIPPLRTLCPSHHISHAFLLSLPEGEGFLVCVGLPHPLPRAQDPA